MLALVLAAALAAPPVPAAVSGSNGWTSIASGLGFDEFDGDYPFAQHRMEIGGGKIRLLISDGSTGAVDRAAIVAWVTTSAEAVTTYFGRFPVPGVTVTVLAGGRGDVGGGTTFVGRHIRVRVGAQTTPADLADDWVLTHEMFHLGFPDLDDEYLWMQEGLSTYLEPIARARIGTLTVQSVWRQMVDGFPNGVPAKGDRGLDHTPDWGNTYWGGCRFWLLADVAIREKTKGTKSLDDAIKAILAAGGDGSQHWDVGDVIAVGDKATGTTVLHDLHAEMGMKPMPAELPALWRKLGVEQRKDKTIVFHDDAPGAWIRKAITERR